LKKLYSYFFLRTLSNGDIKGEINEV